MKFALKWQGDNILVITIWLANACKEGASDSVLYARVLLYYMMNRTGNQLLTPCLHIIDIIIANSEMKGKYE